jgi:type II secretory pathway pseudopilin PulG
MKKTNRNSGYTLTGVIIFLVIVTILWASVMSRIGGYLRTEKAFSTRHAQQNGFTHALAWGVTLLETGLPPAADYSCLMTSPVDSNNVFVTVFSHTADNHYTINVRPANELDMWLPVAPGTFNDSNNP